jgi:hypothetical protein
MVLVFAAPHIVMCAAGRVWRDGEMAPAHTFAICGLCSLWSIGLGFLVYRVLIF